MTIRFLKLRLREVLFLILMLSIIFYTLGSEYISGNFQYIDDIFTIFFISIAILKCFFKKNREKLNIYDEYLIISGILFLLIGLIGNYISKYQTNINVIFVDILSFLKWFAIYVSGIIIFKTKNANRYFDIAEFFSKFILIIIVLLSTCNIVFEWNIGETSLRYGMPILVTLGSHISLVAAVTCGCISILLVDYKKNKKWVLLGMIIDILTLRVKAIGYVVIIMMCLLFNKNKKKFSLKKLFIYAFIAIIVAQSSISGYFLKENGSRGLALKASFKIASEFFPIGSGFATFGTVASVKSYSKAYSKVGLSSRFGFREGQASWVGDGGWATQIGQFGVIGTILYVCMIYFVYCSVKKRINGNINFLPYVSIFIYMLISSTSEIAFSSNFAILLALALDFIVLKGQFKNEIGTKKE